MASQKITRIMQAPGVFGFQKGDPRDEVLGRPGRWGQTRMSRVEVTCEEEEAGDGDERGSLHGLASEWPVRLVTAPRPLILPRSLRPQATTLKLIGDGSEEISLEGVADD